MLDDAEAAAAALDWERVHALADGVLRLDPGNEDARAFLEASTRDTGLTLRARPTESPEGNEPEPALPSSFAAGRYRVERFLGEGGRKRVFLAHDTTLDREVAFALVRAEGFDALARERTLREARAMGRLGAHPHLVAVFDVGEEKEVPFIVEEYMAGGDVATLLADGPLPVERTLAIASDVCRALSFMHGQGLVHRDLKPANVFLTADGTVKVGDFGLALGAEATRLTEHGRLVGTVAYMAPEQALGGDVTARSDLYALGAMLYEMVTGAPPFAGDATAVISQHLNTPPVAPSWHTEHCPPPLEALILSLLEKDPAKRPASADAVLRSLAAVDPSENSQGHTDSNVLDRLARGVFVGRQDELERLRRAFDEAFAGRGSVVMLVGEPGIGKTRTAQELETYARMRGGRVLWGRTHESAGAPPFWPWVQVGRAYAAAREMAEVREDLGPTGRELVRLFPELREAGLEPPEAIDDPEVAQFRLFDAYSRFLATASTRVPLVVVLDDLHWADRPTLKLLQHLARELGHMRALVIGTYRDTDLVRTHPLSETLAELNREGAFERVNLRGLSEGEVAGYITAVAKVAPAASLVTRIYEETEGNPFFLSEVVQLMTEEGALTKESVSDIRLPEGVKEALGRRLDRLSEEANELLKTAAVVGREFAFDTLQLLREGDADSLVKLIEEGLAARVIEEMERPGRFRFTHALMQETLLEELSTTRRVRLHGRIGEALEQRYGSRAQEQAARLALHFVESAALNREHAEKALRYSRLAGEAALERLAWGEAASHFEHALEQAEALGDIESPGKAALHEGLGRAYAATGGMEGEGFRALARAFRIHADAQDAERAFLVAQVVGSSPVLGGASAEGLLREALELQPADSAAAARVATYLAYRLGIRGADDEAKALLDAALSTAARLDDRKLELTILGIRATVDDFNGRDGLEDHLRAAAIADEIGDPRRATGAYFLAGIDLTARFDFERAEKCLTRARQAAEETRYAYSIVSAAYGQAVIRLVLGRHSEREPLDRALELGPADMRPWWIAALRAWWAGDDDEFATRVARLEELCVSMPRIPTVLGYAGFFAWWAHESGHKHYLDFAREMVGRWEQLPSRPALADTLMAPAYAFLAIASGDPAKMTSWHDEPDPRGWVSFSMPPINVLRGLVDEALGRHDEALDHYAADMENVRPSPPLWSLAAYERARLLVELGRPEGAEAVDEVLAVTTRIGMNRWRDKALALKLQLQGIDDVQASIDAVASSIQAERPSLAPHAAPDGTVTLMFTDIVDSTALTQRLGDSTWVSLLHEHNAIVERAVNEHRGHVVKTMGDGFMVAFPSARDGLRCAIAIQRAIASRNDSVDEPIDVRMGLHTGEPVQEAGDFFGTHVNLAARIGAVAAGGEILVSSLLAQLVQPSGDFELEPGTTMTLKGLAGTHQVHRVAWR
ncbi:MAG: hypothetical protein Kow0010_10710 [Dehalococcoidia bacterium]